jgi:hypothetical protein
MQNHRTNDGDGLSTGSVTSGTSVAPAVSATAAVVQPKFPPFYRTNCATWLEQVEAQFALAGITSPATRYYHCLSLLPEDVASLLDLGGEKAYPSLKAQILAAFGQSDTVRLSAILQPPALDGMKPSLAMQKMRRDFRAAGVAPDDRLLKHRLLQALPVSVQVSLAAHLSLPSTEFGSLADTIFELTAGRQDSAVAALHPDSDRRSGSKSRESSPSRRSSSPARQKELTPFKNGQRPVICRSHIFYGDDARTCRHWCRWPGKKPSPRAPSPSVRRPSGN